MIKIFENEDFSSKRYEKAFLSFPDNLKAKVLKKNDDFRRKMCIYEYLCLQDMLKLKNLEKIQFTENGKPFIIGEKHFSISNSENVFCIAVSNYLVGVDIQKIIPFKEKLARKICSEREFESIMCAKEKSLELTKLWTKKESLIKCKGETIGQDLKKLMSDAQNFKFETSMYKNFVVTVCEKIL